MSVQNRRHRQAARSLAGVWPLVVTGEIGTITGVTFIESYRHEHIAKATRRKHGPPRTRQKLRA